MQTRVLDKDFGIPTVNPLLAKQAGNCLRILIVLRTAGAHGLSGWAKPQLTSQRPFSRVGVSTFAREKRQPMVSVTWERFQHGLSDRLRKGKQREEKRGW